jgi:hypothetical protein
MNRRAMDDIGDADNRMNDLWNGEVRSEDWYDDRHRIPTNNNIDEREVFVLMCKALNTARPSTVFGSFRF